MDKKIENYLSELPVLKNETEKITSHIKQLLQEVDKCKRANESASVHNRDALKKIESLSAELVDEEEVNSLLNEKQKFERELGEIKELESATHARLLESYHKKEELKTVISEAQKLIDLLNLEPVLIQKSQKESTLKDLKDFQTKLMTIQEDLTELMKDFKLQVKATNKKIATKKKKIKMQQKKCQVIHKDNVKQQNVLVELKEELDKEKALLEECKEEMEQVMIVGQQTLEYISKGSISFYSSESA